MRAILLSATLAFCFGLAATPAFSALFIVDTNAVDLSDLDPGDGACAWATSPPVGQRCTLRAAVAEANALAGPDVILIPADMTIVLANGEITIGSDMTIGSFEQGDARPVLDANHLSRIFKVDSATSSVVIGNLVIRGGRALGGEQERDGGAIRTGSGNYELSIVGCDFLDNAAGGGGAISTLNSVVSITSSTFTGNFLADPAVDVSPRGSAVWLSGGATTSIEQSTFFLNYSLRASAGSAIRAETNDLQISNSTIDLNPKGGVSSPAPEVSVANSTISNNGVFGFELDGNGTVSFVIRDSIIADNELGCSFDVGFLSTSVGYSLDEDNSCGFFPGGGNLIGVDPKLGPLADNGGSTRTKLLLAGSPALDAGNPAVPGGPGTCLAADQRGVERPQPSVPGGVARCDMGAVEVPEPDGAGLTAIAVVAVLGVARTRAARC